MTDETATALLLLIRTMTPANKYAERFREVHGPSRFRKRSAVDFREYIERLRYSSFRDGRMVSVISIDAFAARLFRDQGANYRKLLGRMNSLWAHENAVDWLDARNLGIVLPDTGLADAVDFVETVRDATDIPSSAIQIYSRDVASSSGNCLPIERLFQKRMPIWKRTFDIIGASILFLLAAPVLLLSCLLVKIDSRGPIFFTQWRIGKGGRPFCILKLRTMSVDADRVKNSLIEQNEQDGLGFKIRHDPRVTSVGKWLRRASIDELPQVLNVLKGEMSLVGPRPLPFSDWHPDEMALCRRHDVPPGLTCTWQISGRSEIGFDEWMRMDISYVEEQCLSHDLLLMLRTPVAVVSQRGAS